MQKTSENDRKRDYPPSGHGPRCRKRRFPSYERIAEKAECSRTTVYEALKVLEWAGVLSWQNRITRIRERCRDLWGREGWRWRVIRTSNAYVFRDPQAAVSGRPASEFGNRMGTLNQEVSTPSLAPTRDPNSPLERALARFSATIAATDSIEQEAAG
jgi:hypothetical protein